MGKTGFDPTDPQKDQINTLDRRVQTTIFRLRTGHCGLRKHLKRLGLADSAQCECGSKEQTPEHILQTCPHLETVRQQFWAQDTEVGTKLLGQAAELQRTADFLAATGMDRQTDRQTDREAETDRQTDRQAETETETQRDRDIKKKQRKRHTDGQAERTTDRQTDRQRERDRQTDRRTNRQRQPAVLHTGVRGHEKVRLYTTAAEVDHLSGLVVRLLLRQRHGHQIEGRR